MRIGEALSSATRARFLGLTLDDYIHYFFRGNAVIAILILLLIMTFLFKEGAEYLPDYNRSYEIYRKSGMEMVTVAREQMDHHQKLLQFLQQVENESEARLSEATLTSLRAQATQLREMIEPNREIIDRWTELTTRVRNTEINNQNLNDAIELWEEKGDMEFVAQLRSELKPVEYNQVQQQLRAEVPLYRNANDSINRQLSQILSQPVSLPAAAQGGYDAFTKSVGQYRDRLPSYIEEMEAWDPEQPVKWTRSLTGFLMGKRWVTNSFWQDVYGVVPLLTGSLMISTLALIVAVPLALASAIYANQIARPFELNLIKPYIEFITAIPSIVLGFFGIVVLGSFLQEVSNWPALSWVPGFPMSERLNITTAGLLLALMAIPTIFTLVEDALNNVPRQYVEASYALGATRLQTILKIMIPAALSGIIAAILLGLGRVIGETMVVLLCAGNRLAIPDFTQGIGAFFEPAHTMTGIIAQEMGEVPPGSVHYRALFMVGIVLFVISLALNYMAQVVVRKFRIAE
jgi:phosphate transport system permease protein